MRQPSCVAGQQIEPKLVVRLIGTDGAVAMFTGSGPIVAAGSFVYVISDGWLLGYSINAATGALMPVPGPNGSFLVTANATPDTSPNFTQVITVNSANGSVTQGAAQQGVTGAPTVSPLDIDAVGQHVYGVGFTDQTCVQNCARAAYSFSVSASSISEIGSAGVDIGSHGNDVIAASPSD